MQETCPRDALTAEAACSYMFALPIVYPLGMGQHWCVTAGSWKDARLYWCREEV